MYIKLLDELQKIVIQNMTTEHNNFDVKIEVESKCTEHNCFPMENCTSYQYVPDNTLEIDVPKYIVLNHKKYYDDNDFFFQVTERHGTTEILMIFNVVQGRQEYIP
ncbi:MAG: hypothetical protein EBX61_03075 [Betaproteobacteria bacterium]|nr:hypothetical protein [Betaproteobacteria bacterium]